MMTTTVVLAEELYETLLSATRQSLETAGVLLARLVPTSTGDLRLLV